MKRVVLIGSESTGKTTLAQQLATHFGVECVPEFVREYAAAKGAPLEFSDTGPIARGQMALEDAARERSLQRDSPLLVVDTDLLSTVIYSLHYYGQCPDWIIEAARHRQPDLYLLTDIDIPWIADPVRDRGDRRPEMHALFTDFVQRSGVPFTLVSGAGAERFRAARDAVAGIVTVSGRYSITTRRISRRNNT